MYSWMILGFSWDEKEIALMLKKMGSEEIVDDVDSIICCSSGVAFSSSALELAIENNIQVVLL